MADATTNTVPDSFVRGSSNGYVADLAALGAIQNSKDIASMLTILGNRMSDDFNAVNVGQANSTLATVTARADVVNSIANHAGVLGVQAEKIATDSQVQVEKVSAAIQLQSEKIASASVLLATQIAAAASKEACECCCKVQNAIHHEAEETRELLNEIDRRHSDRREADLKIDLSNARQTLSFERMLDEKFERFGRGRGHCPVPPPLPT